MNRRFATFLSAAVILGTALVFLLAYYLGGNRSERQASTLSPVDMITPVQGTVGARSTATPRSGSTSEPLSTTPISTPDGTPAPIAPSEPVRMMMKYLAKNHDPGLGLVREAPNVAPNLFWLYTDNYLAQQALRDLEPHTATAIRSAMQKYKFEPLERYHVLEGKCVAQRLFELGHVSRDIAVSGDKRIRTDVVDPSIDMTDWQEYADRLLEAAINAFNCGDKTRAQELFKKAQAMFDGVGIADKVHSVDGNYETYKLALYLIAARRMGIDLPNKQVLVNLILGLQDKDPSSNRYGGIRTHYSAPSIPVQGCDTNAETTALCILALSL